LRRSPKAAGLDRARWSLAALTTAVGWLAGLSLGGVRRLLGRFRIRYRRGQEHLHSPDPDYDKKMQAVEAARLEAQRRPGEVVLLYQDEFTYYRRSSVAKAWQPSGGPGRYAEQGHGRNRKRRVIGAVDAGDGRLFCWQRADAKVGTLKRYYRALEAAYPRAEVIYLAQDNWPVHFHADVLKSLEGSKIRLLRLPTYAPWTNPIEKVWRWLKQDVLHQHEYGDDWPGLQAAVTNWLAQWAGPSPRLLRYIGLQTRSN
jgi:transposase